MPHPFPLLAFGFANLAMLGWLAAAAAPIIIHLWMRHTHRETPWAAMRFLRAAIERHSRRLRFEQWLLLAIRTALLALVALAAAKPFFDNWRFGGAGLRTHHLLVLDGSFSMGYRVGEETLFSRAKQLATELVESSPAGDSFSLCVLAENPTAPLRQPLSDRAGARQALQSAELTQTPVNLSASLRLVNQMLTDAKAKTAQIDRHEVLFFTDLAQRTWGPACETAADDEDDQPALGPMSSAAESLTQLSSDAVVSVVDVGEEGARNTAITACQVADDLPTAQQPVTITGRIASFGPQPPESIAVELVVDGVAVGEQTVRLANGAGVVEFAHRFARPGAHAVSLRAPTDPLPLDNQRYTAPRVVDQIDVLLVEGRRGAGRYVASALESAGGSANGDSVFRVRTVSDGELNTLSLSPFACVYLCNVPQLSRAEAGLLERYVAAGGGLVLFLGDAVEPEPYNAAFAVGPAAAGAPTAPFQFVANSTTTGLLPARIEAAISRPAGVLDPLDYRHPIVQAFRGQQRAGLLTTPISRYHRLRPASLSEGAEVALAADNGDPLIVTRTFERGRCVLIATASSLESVDAAGQPWTALPAWPSFLPLVREITNYVSAGQRDAATVQVGETLRGEGPGVATEELVLERPDRRADAVTLDAAANSWSYPRTDVAGVYRLTHGADAAAAFAVNVDPAESDLRRLAAQRLPAEIQVRRVPTSQATGGESLGQQAALHRWLLTVALVLALAETFLAQRFGRGGVK